MPRTIALTTPYTHGDDVKVLQRAIRHIITLKEGSSSLVPDGEYGPASRDAEAHAAYLLGLASPRDHKRAQAVIR
ncbi:MAG: hypothetical protein JWM31_2837, partial [Solirubrobacterales bacterium]|nr:hypothetical protein [Solirubrobacterales bacterium]